MMFLFALSILYHAREYISGKIYKIPENHTLVINTQRCQEDQGIWKQWLAGYRWVYNWTVAQRRQDARSGAYSLQTKCRVSNRPEWVRVWPKVVDRVEEKSCPLGSIMIIITRCATFYGRIKARRPPYTLRFLYRLIEIAWTGQAGMHCSQTIQRDRVKVRRPLSGSSLRAWVGQTPVQSPQWTQLSSSIKISLLARETLMSWACIHSIAASSSSMSPESSKTKTPI